MARRPGVRFVTYPYGTRKPCVVKDVLRDPRITAIVCEADGEPTTGYVCLYRPDQVNPERGERGVLTFVRGGQTGGFWQYSKEAP